MANGNIVGMFKVMMLVMLFYSFAITVLTYALPTNSLNYVTEFSNDDTTNFEGISTEIEDSLTRQTNIPVLEVGALVFYSGNILIDLLLNFLYALPQMFGFLVFGLGKLFNLDNNLFVYLQTFASVAMTALYMIGIIQLLAGIRSGRVL